MEDTQTTPVTEATPETTTAPDAAAAQTAPEPSAAPESVDLSALDRVDPDALRKHPRVAGIVGDMLHRAKQSWESEQKAQTAAEAAEAERTRLRELRRSDPYAYAQEMDAKDEREEAEKRIAGLRQSTQAEMVKQIGRALGEQAQLTQAEVERLASALAGKQDGEVLPAFADAIADIKAERRLAEWRAKELAREREAWAQEEASRRLAQGGQRPDLARPAGAPPRIDPSKLSDTEFNEWYERTVLRR